jgi:hypothetical protein
VHDFGMQHRLDKKHRIHRIHRIHIRKKNFFSEVTPILKSRKCTKLSNVILRGAKKEVHPDFETLRKMRFEFFAVGFRVARFFFVQNTKMGKIYQINTNYTKCP